MENFEVLVAIVTVLAAVLLFISILAYKRERSWRLLFATVVFSLFLIKGMVMTLAILNYAFVSTIDSQAFHLLFDVVILLFLFFAVIKVPKNRQKAESASRDADEENG